MALLESAIAGGTYIEEYDEGELKRRIKWRKDKLHVKCTRCSAPAVADFAAIC